MLASSGLPVFALVGGILLGALVWWAIAHAFRDKSAEQQGVDAERGDGDAATAAPAPVTPAEA